MLGSRYHNTDAEAKEDSVEQMQSVAALPRPPHSFCRLLTSP